MMNRNKVIALKDPKLKKIRENLREVIYQAVMDRKRELRALMENEDRDTEEGYKRYNELANERGRLDAQMRGSTVACPACNFGLLRDVKYNTYDKGWYCLECYNTIRLAYRIRQEDIERGMDVDRDYDEDFARSFLD
ncbi:MAG: hypothetical protein EU532_13725 [Promethearchaeota archaeon]|nr:MAG: hypothetical protein EU532_13725 [Candidatus Lokiarchaeota archaeon]